MRVKRIKPGEYQVVGTALRIVREVDDSGINSSAMTAWYVVQPDGTSLGWGFTLAEAKEIASEGEPR